MNQQCPQQSVPRRSSLSAETSDPQLHQYSCATCRSRKIKCNKIITGCATCKKLGIPCVYSARRTQQSQRARQPLTIRPLACAEIGPDDELPGKVKRAVTNSSKSSASPSNSISTPQTTGSQNLCDNGGIEDLLVPQEMRDPSFQSQFDIRQPNEGRLLVADGESRYITGRKASQVAGVESILSSIPSQKSGEEHPLISADISHSPIESLTCSLMFYQPSFALSLQSYHPTPEITIVLWEYYISNVDILVKILHKPTTEALIISSCKALEEIDAPTEALIFGIYFAAVTSMSTDECLKLHGEERSLLMQRYGCALQYALSRAQVFTAQKVAVLQAMILLIMCSARKNTQTTWMMTGNALRIAQAMGMHRDSTSFPLSTIEVEVRRRVWWTLCVIDHRISVDGGFDCNVPMTMDTKLPLHINDSDIGNREPLVSRSGFTEMTISLIKLEMVETTLKLKACQFGKYCLTMEEMETLVQEQQSQFENSYLQYLDPSLHLHHLMYLGTRLAIANLWKLVYETFLKSGSAHLNGDIIKERLILHNIEIIEIMNQLPGKSSKFGWFFCQHTKWHAVVYLFTELSNQYEGPIADRAWAALDALFGITDDEDFDDLNSNHDFRQSILWKPLQKLLMHAHRLRKQVIQPIQFDEFDNISAATSSLETIPTPVDVSVQPSREISSSVDPFLGSVPNFSEEMNWEEWDSLLQKLPPDLLHQQDFMDYQEENPIQPLNWWC